MLPLKPGSRRAVRAGLGMAGLMAIVGLLLTRPQCRELDLVARRAPVAATPTPPEHPPAPAAAAPQRGDRRASSRPEVMDRALTEPDPKSRIAELQLALQSWAEKDPAAAAQWALAQQAMPLDLALAAVFRGAAVQPAAALELHGQLVAAQPSRAGDCGGYLIAGLGRAHAHAAAATFALGADPHLATGWLTAAYTEWARQEPREAMDAVARIADPDRQFTAFRAMVAGWSQADPAQLVATASSLAAGPERQFALLTGLRAWVEKDPDAAAEWVARAPSDIDWDLVLDN